jgi:hypothetical protein
LSISVTSVDTLAPCDVMEDGGLSQIVVVSPAKRRQAFTLLRYEISFHDSFPVFTEL